MTGDGTLYSILFWCIVAAQTTQAEIVQLTYDPSTNRAPSWHPEGTHVAFESDRHGNWDIFVLDRATGIDTALTVADADDRYPAWSPSGDAIVFVSDRAGSPDLYLMDMRTGQIERLTTLAGEEIFPDWSPDGRSVVFSLATEDAVRLMTVTLDERTAVPLLAEAHRSLWPRWSPGADELAFFSRRDTDGEDDEVYVFSRSAGTARRVTHRLGHDFCPTWNPTGTMLAMVSILSGGSRAIRIVTAADGAERGRIGVANFRVTEPAWSPDGEYIAYAARTSPDAFYQLYIELVPQAAR